MSVQALARSAFATLKAQHPECVVAVVGSLGQTAQGFRHNHSSTSGLDMEGERGRRVATVHVDASEIEQPDDGCTIQVGGEKVTVMETRPDPAGALLAINYMVGKLASAEAGI